MTGSSRAPGAACRRRGGGVSPRSPRSPYAVLPWQTVVACASWAVGAGALFVAPAAGVVVADYWVRRDRVVDRDALQTGATRTPAGPTTAVAALFAGMVPEWSFARTSPRTSRRGTRRAPLQSVMDSVAR